MNDSLPSDAQAPTDEQRVAGWLERNPDFFNRYPELLDRLQVPHPSGSAVSLVERQVARLRERSERAEAKLTELIELARANERLAHRIHQFALALIQAESLEAVLDRARDSLHNDFGAEQVVLRLIDRDGGMINRDADTFIAPQDPGLNLFETFFERRRATSGRLTRAQREYLFREDRIDTASAALVPIYAGEAPLGLLALASHDPNRFHPALGVLFLNHLGDLLGCALQRYIGR